MTNLVTVLIDAAPLVATGLIADGALWRTARDDYEFAMYREGGSAAEVKATGDAKTIIAERIAETLASTLDECAPKLSIIRDCYEGLDDMDDDVAGRAYGGSELSRTMALSLARDLLTLATAPAH